MGTNLATHITTGTLFSPEPAAITKTGLEALAVSVVESEKQFQGSPSPACMASSAVLVKTKALKSLAWACWSVTTAPHAREGQKAANAAADILIPVCVLQRLNAYTELSSKGQ